MLAVAARLWWVLVLQGILGIAFGILALVFPGLALATLALVFAAWAIISGLSHLGEGMRVAEARGRSWPFAVIGVLSIVAGIIAALVPGITILGLVLLLGAWLVTQGVMEIYTAWRIRREVSGEWIIALGGIVRTVIGVIVLAMPVIGLILTATLLAVYAIVAGFTALTLGWRLRSLRSTPSGSAGRTASAGV
ncbi:MAG: hypothetical protein QOE42_2289 [Chloroflexota bacterium]|jgi:uncharacterized membrane protein HdeD (DUF308 family)|nr:hypothetical protein [Chloroflexota bacterium]